MKLKLTTEQSEIDNVTRGKCLIFLFLEKLKSTSYFLLKLSFYSFNTLLRYPLENDGSLILIKNTVDRIKVRRKNLNKDKNDNKNKIIAKNIILTINL